MADKPLIPKRMDTTTTNIEPNTWTIPNITYIDDRITTTADEYDEFFENVISIINQLIKPMGWELIDIVTPEGNTVYFPTKLRRRRK